MRQDRLVGRSEGLLIVFLIVSIEVSSVINMTEGNELSGVKYNGL